MIYDTKFLAYKKLDYIRYGMETHGVVARIKEFAKIFDLIVYLS